MASRTSLTFAEVAQVIVPTARTSLLFAEVAANIEPSARTSLIFAEVASVDSEEEQRPVIIICS